MREGERHEVSIVGEDGKEEIQFGKMRKASLRRRPLNCVLKEERAFATAKSRVLTGSGYSLQWGRGFLCYMPPAV